jgi:hypothetical protein
MTPGLRGRRVLSRRTARGKGKGEDQKFSPSPGRINNWRVLGSNRKDADEKVAGEKESS